MSSKTDKNFIYDYLIHLDSFLLHGVSEVGAPQIKSSPYKPQIENTAFTPYCNKNSPIAFVNLSNSSSNENMILNSDELQLFNKIIVAMGLTPANIYLTSINKSNIDMIDTNTLKAINNELNQINCQYIVLLGIKTANQFINEKIMNYDLNLCWQESELFNRKLILVTIPSLEEMLDNPNHKKFAWAHLKKISEQLHIN